MCGAFRFFYISIITFLMLPIGVNASSWLSPLGGVFSVENNELSIKGLGTGDVNQAIAILDVSTGLNYSISGEVLLSGPWGGFVFSYDNDAKTFVSFYSSKYDSPYYTHNSLNQRASIGRYPVRWEHDSWQKFKIEKKEEKVIIELDSQKVSVDLPVNRGSGHFGFTTYGQTTIKARNLKLNDSTIQLVEEKIALDDAHPVESDADRQLQKPLRPEITTEKSSSTTRHPIKGEWKVYCKKEEDRLKKIFKENPDYSVQFPNAIKNYKAENEIIRLVVTDTNLTFFGSEAVYYTIDDKYHEKSKNPLEVTTLVDYPYKIKEDLGESNYKIEYVQYNRFFPASFKVNGNELIISNDSGLVVPWRKECTWVNKYFNAETAKITTSNNSSVSSTGPLVTYEEAKTKNDSNQNYKGMYLAPVQINAGSLGVKAGTKYGGISLSIPLNVPDQLFFMVNKDRAFITTYSYVQDIANPSTSSMVLNKLTTPILKFKAKTNEQFIELYNQSTGQLVGKLEFSDNKKKIICSSCEDEGLPMEWVHIPKYDDSAFKMIWENDLSM